MSLVSTLAKVAVGVAVAKGVSSMTRGRTQQPGGGAAGGRLADMLGGMMGGGAGASPAGGGLADMLGGMMGGGAAARGAAPGGGLADMLGQALGGGAGRGGALGGAGGLGGLLDSLGGAGGAMAAGAGAGGLGALLNQALQGGTPKARPTRAQEDEAALLLRAMIMAAKSDGRIDEAEKAALTGFLGDVSPEEARVLEDAFDQPVDAGAIAAATPRGMEQQVYAISLMGLDIDSEAEARYIHALGQALGIEAATANAIHEKMGEPALYR